MFKQSCEYTYVYASIDQYKIELVYVRHAMNVRFTGIDCVGDFASNEMLMDF